MKPRVQCKNWYLPKYNGDYTVLFCDTVNHPRLGAAKGVRTSRILSVDLSKREVETRNNVYELLGDEVKI